MKSRVEPFAALAPSPRGPVTRRAVRSLLVALLSASIAGAAAGQEEQASGELAPGTQDAIGAAWLDQLNAYYASGDPADQPPTTEQGHGQLQAFDWRVAAVESGIVTFEETWAIRESTQWDEAFEDGETTSFELRIGLDAQPLAETKSAISSQTVEMSGGLQRRAFNVTFVPDEATGEWVLDAIGPPAGGNNYEFGLRRPRPVVPCPRLGDPSTAQDPFAMEPWCTAGGDGRELKVSPYRRADRHLSELYFDTTSCHRGAIFLWTGWPLGEPRDPTVGFRNTYVRDPRGTVKGVKGYRRNATLPKDAVSTGVTNGYATIWTSARVGERAIFVQVGDRFERWPRDTSIGCPSN